MKKILIAIPTAKYIETDTFKSVFNFIKPDGYELDFECFYGYRIDQVRNLMAHYTKINDYDYIFFIDADMVIPPDAIVKLLNQNVDIIGAPYRQRSLEVIVPEVYFAPENGGSRNATVEELIYAPEVFPVDSIGFGCVLIKSEVLKNMDYPHFDYKHSIDFKDSVSEDTYFCRKARAYGHETYCLKTVTPGHIMKTTLWLDTSTPKEVIPFSEILPKDELNNELEHY